MTTARKANGLTMLEVLLVILITVALLTFLAELAQNGFFYRGSIHQRSAPAQNNRQIALAAIMYAGDNDDGLPLTLNGELCRLQNRRPGELTINCPGPGTQDFPAHDAAGARPTLAWPGVLESYLKSSGLFVDPGRGDLHKIWAGPPTAPGDAGYDQEANTLRNQNRFPMFGYNYMFLSPLRIPAGKRDLPDAVNYTVAESHKTSEPADPSRTVFFTESQRSLSDTSRGFFVINAPGMWPSFADSKSGFVAFWTGTLGSGDWVGTKTACADDSSPCDQGIQSHGFVYSNNGYAKNPDGADVTFVDGHVKFMHSEALSAGTNYLTATAGSSGSPGSGAVITDPKHYLWDLK